MLRPIRERNGKTVFLVFVICLVPTVGLLIWYIRLLLVFSIPAVPPEVAAQTAATLWNKPLPKPLFLTALAASSNAAGVVHQLCADLNTSVIWEPGDFGEDTYHRVVDTTQVELDGLVIPPYDLSIGEEPVALLRRDATGKVVGSQGGEMSTCFNIPRLGDGLHLAVLRFQTRSGKTLEYQWAFKTATKNGQLMPILPALP